MSLPPDLSALDHAARDALILLLMARLDRLEAENAALRARLGDPPKTPFELQPAAEPWPQGLGRGCGGEVQGQAA